MTALPTLCLRSHAISLRRPCAVLRNACRNDNERMHASTLSLATSMPTTMRSFCAIIQLPSLLGPGSKPMQLFGLRKTPDLSLAPRQALWPSSTNGLRSSERAVGENRPFAHSGRFCGHKSAKETVKTIARGMPDVSGVTVVTNACAFYHCARGCGRAERPAFPAPSFSRVVRLNDSDAGAPRESEVMTSTDRKLERLRPVLSSARLTGRSS